jgi:phosphomevalonate kinase
MLAGEYAVVDGGPAVLVGASTRAYAEVCDDEQRLSPFLAEVQRTLAEEFGDRSMSAIAAKCLRIDTSAFRQEKEKLGLGSSAAATVAGMAAALAAGKQNLQHEYVNHLAARAHGKAQEKMGAKGSGADVAACTFGGCIRYQLLSGVPDIRRIALPTHLHLRFPWTGTPASTPELVGQVMAFRKRDSRTYQDRTSEMSQCADQLASALDANAAVAAIGRAGTALRALGEAAGVELWLAAHDQLLAIANDHGGALKPTGAGGGDLALAAFSNAESAQAFEKSLLKLGILCPDIDVDTQGVRLQV